MLLTELLFGRILGFVQVGQYILLSQFGCVNSTIGHGRSYKNCNIDISGCLFMRSMTFNGYGGVIVVIGDEYRMIIGLSLFHNCYSTLQGGAIFFSGSEAKLTKCCTYECHSQFNHFAFINSTKSIYIDQISISRCWNTTIGWSCIYLLNGDQKLENFNCSMNHALSSSSVMIDNPLTFSSAFCLFSTNRASQGVCIHLNGKTGVFTYSIIIWNNSPYEYGIVVVTNMGSYVLDKCIFANNNNTLFCLKNSNLQIINSFIYHYERFSEGNDCVLYNNSFTMAEIYSIVLKNECNPNNYNNLQSPTIQKNENDHISINNSVKALIILSGLVVLLVIVMGCCRTVHDSIPKDDVNKFITQHSPDVQNNCYQMQLI